MRVVAIAAVALCLGGCDAGPACGQGTTLVAGLCLSTSGARPAVCGPATEWDPATETCVGVSHTVCGDGTTAEVDDDGTTICIADGRPRCELECPYPEVGEAVICARMFGTDGSPLGAIPSARLCDPMAPASSGPCAYAIDVIDVVDGTPIAADARWNDCGYVVIEGLDPSPGSVVLRASRGSDTRFSAAVDITGGKRAQVRIEVAP